MEAARQNAFVREQLGKGEDGGALRMLGDQLLEPAVSRLRAEPAWRRQAGDWGRLLADFAGKTVDPEARARAGQLALRMLQETLAAPDRDARLVASPRQPGQAWLDPGHLLRAVAHARPPGVVRVLAAMLQDASLSLRARSFALVAYGELGGKRPPHADAIFDALLASEPDPGFSGDGRVNALARAGVIPPERLCDALARPEAAEWRDEIGAALAPFGAMPEGPQVAARLTGMLLQALADPGSARSVLHAVARALVAMPRTAQQNEEVVAALQAARREGAARADAAERGDLLLRLLHGFGALTGLELRRARFDASSAREYLHHPATRGYLLSGFSGGTLVHTPSGAARIDSLKAGDLVLSRDEAGGPVEPRRVLRVQCAEEVQLLLVGFRPQDPQKAASAPLQVGSDHPVWHVTDGWTAAQSLRGDEAAEVLLMDGTTAVCSSHTHAYRTDQPQVGWVSDGRSRSYESGKLRDFAQARWGGQSPYDWDRWDPQGDPDAEDDDVLYRGPAWDLLVEGTHSYFVGPDGVWVWDASLDGGFRREHAAQQVASRAAWDRAVAAAAARQPPPPREVRYPDGSLVQQGDAVIVSQGQRPGRVEGHMHAGERVVWISVDLGSPGQTTLVPVVDGVVAGLRKQPDPPRQPR